MYPTHRLEMTPERLVGQMDTYRITASVAVSAAAVFYDQTLGNAAALEAAKSSNRIIPSAAIDPTRFFGGAEQLSALRQNGFRICRFSPAEQDWRLDSPAFLAVLKGLSGAKMPVMLDVSQPGDVAMTARAAAGYPSPVIISGCALDILSDCLAVMSEMPNVMIETHALRVPGALSLIAGTVGADRIVFGSGTPRISAASSIQYILSSDLADEDKRKVLGGNIQRILEAA
jgi:predicted TIM-barrel fold metal-dependent hydrolase